MNNLITLILVAGMGGIAVALQAQFMGLMDRGMGTLESVFITYGGGALIIGVVMLVLRGGNLRAWPTVPWYTLLAGATGLVIVGSLSFTTNRLGVVGTFTVFIATQFITGAVIDHFGWFGADIRPFTLERLIGVGVLLFGVWLIIR